MKKTIALAAVLLGSAAVSSLFAQGQVLWGNNFTGVTSARIYGVDPANPTLALRGNALNGTPPGTTVYNGPLLLGTSYTMGLFLGNDNAAAAASMVADHTQAFRTGNAAGLVGNFAYNDPTRVPGTIVSAQFRAWDNQMNTVTSWAEVMARGGEVPAGSSDPFAVGPLGGTHMGTVFNTPSTFGIRSFNLTVVPEPSLIALGALGLGALLLRRRK
jgi:hypothetical protein